MDIASLALAIKDASGGMTGAQIQALDESYLCQNPQQAYQTLKSCGYPITVSTNTDGTPLYKITS
jgi:hypothetical protein